MPKKVTHGQLDQAKALLRIQSPDDVRAQRPDLALAVDKLLAPPRTKRIPGSNPKNRFT